MSGERPSPLHNSPEGVSGHWRRLQEEGRLSGNNKRENQRTEAPEKGVVFLVPKQGEGTIPNQQTRKNPVLKHVQELQQQAEPIYSQERIEEARKKWSDLTTEQIIWRLKREDERKDDEKHGRRRGFSF